MNYMLENSPLLWPLVAWREAYRRNAPPEEYRNGPGSR